MSLGTILARQDRDCIDRAKFRYNLPSPLPDGTFAKFDDARIVVRAFSKVVPLAKDLFSIVKPNAFRIDGILGAKTMVVTFEGDAVNWPVALLADVEGRLKAAGYGAVSYDAGAGPRCSDCAMRFAKRCAGMEGGPAPQG